jgi:hypothetical protein
VGLFELMVMNDQLREVINASTDELRDACGSDGSAFAGMAGTKAHHADESSAKRCRR